MNLAIGHLFYVQLLGGSNTLPLVDESWMTSLKERVTPLALNFPLIGKITSSIIKGLTPVPLTAPLIRLPEPLGQGDAMFQLQAAGCEVILDVMFGQEEPELLDRLWLYKGKAPGAFQDACFPFVTALLTYRLAAIGKLPEPEINLKKADQEIESIKSLSDPPTSCSNFRKSFFIF